MKTAKSIVYFVGFLFICWTAPVFAATYWVSPTGTATTWDNHATTGCQSATDPPTSGKYCTLAIANLNATAGEIVNLKSGTYTELYGGEAVGVLRPTSSGTAGNVITFQTAPNETIAVISSGRSGGYERAILITGKSYIKINRIKVTTSTYGISIIGGSTYNEVTNCEFDTNFAIVGQIHSYDTGGNFIAGSQHNWIHGNTFTKFGSGGGEGCVHSGFFMIGFGNLEDQSWYNTVEDNVFSYGGHDTLNFSNTKYNVARNNVSHQEEAYFLDGACNRGTVSGYLGNRNFVIENNGDGGSGINLFEGNRLGYAGTPPDHHGANGLEDAGEYTINRYNFLYGNGATGIYSKNQGSGNNHARIYNNTVYSNGLGDVAIDSQFKHAIMIVSWSGFPVHDIVVKNNLLYGNVIDDITGVPSDYCTDCVVTSNLQGTDPSFVNSSMSDKTSTTLPNLGLVSSSAAIDGGTYLTTAHGAGAPSTTLIVHDALYFQAGSAAATNPLGASISNIAADYIAIGTVTNTVQITDINYTTNTITLASAMTWADDAPVWLYKKSDGVQVLYGAAPDYGAYEYGGEGSAITTNLGTGDTVKNLGTGGIISNLR